MQAIADTKRLVADGVITEAQARTIEVRARAAMVYLAINCLLVLGILAATGGFIAWLGTPASVAVTGLVFLGLGCLVLLNGGALYGMFGNAAALIGGGMLIGGASIELMDKHGAIAGPLMIGLGLAIAAVSAWRLNTARPALFLLIAALLLMGLAMHLVGIGFLLAREGISGAPISAFYLYATSALVVAGWLTDARVLTALAIVPFAQALDTGTYYFEAAYVFYSPEPTLSILQMGLLVAACLWVSSHRPERISRHAGVLAVMAFIVANLCALVGSLWGDVVGLTLWGPGSDYSLSDMTWDEWVAAKDAFRESSIVISADLYSILWALALAALVLWSAHTARRGLFNTSLTFAALHGYTQMFETFYDEPFAYVIGGLAAIPLAWGMWRLDHWIAARGHPAASP